MFIKVYKHQTNRIFFPHPTVAARQFILPVCKSPRKKVPVVTAPHTRVWYGSR
jgi:hypothetical protein